MYALSFKYREGLLIDYAMRKERLLLDMNKDMDSKTLITLITTGLPEFIMNRLDREELQDTTDLFNEIRKYESLMNKKNFTKKKKWIIEKEMMKKKNM